MVSQRTRIAPTRSRGRRAAPTLGFARRRRFGFFRSATPSSGAKITATNQDTISAMLTTAKIEKVYSPAALRAKPIGTKPAIVTKVPVSIGKASVL